MDCGLVPETAKTDHEELYALLANCLRLDTLRLAEVPAYARDQVRCVLAFKDLDHKVSAWPEQA